MTLLTIYGIGVAAIFAVVFDDVPPYPSRDLLPWLAGAAVLWPLVLAIGVPLWLYITFRSLPRI